MSSRARHCAGYWGHSGDYDCFILVESMVWKGQSLSSSHSVVSAPQRRTFMVLGESKAGGRSGPESQGRLPGGRNISQAGMGRGEDRGQQEVRCVT